MKSKKKYAHFILGLQEFRNINLASKGCYKIKVEVFVSSKYMNLEYVSNEDLQEDKPELKNNYSIKVQCHSDIHDLSHTSQKNIDHEFSSKNSFFTLPFFVKYHCERIKLKSVALFTQTTAEEFINVRLTLWKKQAKSIAFEYFQPLESVQFSVSCNDHFLEQKDILIPNSQCCSLKIIILNCPLNSYQEIHNYSSEIIKQMKFKKNQEKQQILLEQIRKMVKKQRYEAFIIRKQICDVLKNVQNEPIKLPLHFVDKENMSMDEVETNELKFFKYLAFYEKYYTSSEMLKQQIEHINFDKITILKNFIDGFQKNSLLLSVLDEKEKQALGKKYKTYLIESETRLTQDNLLSKYSQQEFKAKKQKIKQIDAILSSGNYLCDHLFEHQFFNQKELKNIGKERLNVKYPLVFRDKNVLSKENVMRSDTVMVCVLHKNIRKKKKYFIFAHGFQGLPVDLTYLINMIRFSNERIKTLVLKSYKNNMGQSIELMATKAAQEIQNFFKKIDLTQIQPEITFIGHSMGPIILRAAFKHLSSYHEYFQTFISICGPHLGYIQGTKFLTQAGLSIISKFKPIQSLNQLSNRDNSDLEKTFIYKLSKEGSLKYFRRIMLIASMEDDYVPWHSARIEPFSQKGNKEKVQRDMISNIFGFGVKQTKIESIERIEVHFPHQKQKSLNSLIGRTSHIKPLSDRGFLEILTKQLLFN